MANKSSPPSPKRLNLVRETIRTLKPLDPDDLAKVAGGTRTKTYRIVEP